MKALPSLPRAFALLVVVLLPGCNNSRDNSNPFAGAAQTVAPPKGSALIFASSIYSTTPGAGRELFAVDADGANLTRLTFCNNSAGICDFAEAAPAADRVRVGARRASVDNNGDGLINETDGMGLVFMNLSRGVEAVLVPASRRVSGVDWAPSTSDFFVYSALPAGGGNEDLFTIDFNGQNDRNLTCPADPTTQCNVAVRERRPRLDSGESAAAFQRIDATGTSVIAIFASFGNQPALTTGPADADPVFAPDTRHVAFRRLTDAAANGGKGSWDIVTVAQDGTGAQVIASGPAYRGAPDWGVNGIAWAEADAAGQRLVVTGPDGSGARTIVTQPAGIPLDNPRWLKPE